MATFLIIAAIGYAIMAMVDIIDKSILTGTLRVPVYTFYSTFFLWGAFLALPWSEPITFTAFLIALLSGLSFGCATWALFTGLQNGQAAHVVPFIGAVTAVFVFGLSSIFLGESFLMLQVVGIIILIGASLLFSYDKNSRHKGIHPAFRWGLLSGFLFAVSHVSAKYFYMDYSFLTGLVWTKGLIGIIAIVTLFSASVRRDIFGKRKPQKKDAGNAALPLVITDKVLSVVGTVAIQYAISIGSVAIVSGLVGVQYAFILIFAYLSTMLTPRFFTEYFTVKEVYIEVVAIVLVVTGIFLII